MLKKTCLVSLVMLLCSGSAFAVQEIVVAWSKVNSTEGRFNAVMPTKPETASREVDSALGKLMLYTFTSSNKVGYFMISYADYPNEPTIANQEGLLNGVTGGVIKGLEAELISETKFNFKGHPGRDFRAKRIVEGNEVVFTWKTLLVGRRLYQMGVATNTKDADAPDLQRFFTSFQLSN